MHQGDGLEDEPHTKRRRLEPASVPDTVDTRNVRATSAISAARTCSYTRPIVRPPEAPFYPDAIELWVVRDAKGEKHLVSTMEPGSQHWRIGDPNVKYCVECKEEDDEVVGCRTCKKSYHLSCLGSDSLKPQTSQDALYCPLCVMRGWHVQPPADILPLTPIASRASSPAADARPNAATRMPGLKITNPDPDQPMLSGLREAAASFQEGLTRSRTDPVANLLGKAKSTVIVAGGKEKNQEATQPRTGYVTKYDLQPPGRLPSPITPAPNVVSGTALALAGAGSKRPKSRYQTMPPQVDQALAIIYRELEGVTILKQDSANMQAQLRTAEQGRRMAENQLALERSSAEHATRKDAEIAALRKQLAVLERVCDELQQENADLRQQGHSAEEVQALKASLRKLLGE